MSNLSKHLSVEELQRKLEYLDISRVSLVVLCREKIIENRTLQNQVGLLENECEALKARVAVLENQVGMIETQPPVSIRNRTIARLQAGQRSASLEVVGSPSEETPLTLHHEIGPHVRENRTSRLRTREMSIRRAQSQSASRHCHRNNR